MRQSVVMPQQSLQHLHVYCSNPFRAHCTRTRRGGISPFWTLVCWYAVFSHVFPLKIKLYINLVLLPTQPSCNCTRVQPHDATAADASNSCNSANRTCARPVVDASQSRVIIFKKISGVVVQESSRSRPTLRIIKIAVDKVTLISGKDLREYL